MYLQAFVNFCHIRDLTGQSRVIKNLNIKEAQDYIYMNSKLTLKYINEIVLETDRLYLRQMQQSDYTSLCEILQDEEVMYAYEGAFSDAEVQNWLDRQLNNYEVYGFGLWAVILKESDKMIGQCGLTMQAVNDKQVIEIGYLYNKTFWHQGYAIEAAKACKEYAFEKLGANEVFSIIRDTNTASQNVAKHNGMAVADQLVKHYRGVTMPHLVFSITQGESDNFH